MLPEQAQREFDDLVDAHRAVRADQGRVPNSLTHVFIASGDYAWQQRRSEILLDRLRRLVMTTRGLNKSRMKYVV